MFDTCPAPKLKKQQTKAINKCIQDTCSRGLQSIFLYKEFLVHYVKATSGCLKWMM